MCDTLTTLRTFDENEGNEIKVKIEKGKMLSSTAIT